MQYGLIGEHLSHSYSCEIHGMLYKDAYELKELPPEGLADFMTKKPFRGINVTIPYKKDVIPFLQHISPTARAIGAVNTVVNRDGALWGYNTDLAGILGLVKHLGLSIKEKKVLIAGTGGTSLTALYAMQTLEAREIYRISRTPGEGVITYQEAKEKHRDAQIIMNTTPLGMFPRYTGQKPLDVADFPALEGVLDAVYHPISTPLVQDARALGIPAEGGLYMLVTQAIHAAALFRDKEPEEEVAEEVYRALSNQKQNIVLIGMPSSGKSTVGQALAAGLGRPFVDTDALVTTELGMPIADFFAQQGEAAFRRVESKVIAKVACYDGYVIATGGGAVLDPDNIRALKQNGQTIFLDRPLSLLCATKDRPLSSDIQALKNLYDTRYPLYKAAADHTVDGGMTVEQVVSAIRKELEL